MNRISRVALILCACFVSVAWGQQPVGKCYNRWAQFHKYDMQRWNRCEKVLGVNNVGNLALKWSYTDGNQVTSSPAVADGMVYVGSDYPGQNIYAVNAKTGARVWSYTPGAGVFHSSPAVANGVVYIGSEDYNVYALNAKTGAKLWSYATGSSVLSSPAVANGVVYVGSTDNNVYAFGLN
jgi:outer membrane protein assembly factor BamB